MSFSKLEYLSNKFDDIEDEVSEIKAESYESGYYAGYYDGFDDGETLNVAGLITAPRRAQV
ncbi:MAG: hypothetical protein K2P67_07485 [Gallionellaceae bacterium]|jgi:hypothetical protein|nr:hypothetical protein [Gallionellaceae bacterium]